MVTFPFRKGYDCLIWISFDRVKYDLLYSVLQKNVIKLLHKIHCSLCIVDTI